MFGTCLSGLGTSECAWIGAANWNAASEYRWLSQPTNPNYSYTTGELLTNTYSNFASGNNSFQLLFANSTPF